jgi:hypothetical protein
VKTRSILHRRLQAWNAALAAFITSWRTARVRMFAVAGAAALLAVPLTAAAAAPSFAAQHVIEITVSGSHVSASGARVVGSVAYGPGVTKTTIKPTAATASWVCNVYSYTPYKSGSYIKAKAVQDCTGSGFDPIDVCDTIQRLRWYGWENQSTSCSGYGYTISDSTIASWYCGGVGTYTYNGAANGYAEGGAYGSGQVNSYNTYRTSC